MLLRSPRALAAAALVAAAGPLLCCPAPALAMAAARADGADCASVSADDTENKTVTGDNDANNALRVPEATSILRKAGRKPGQGVTVVVVDSLFKELKPGEVRGLDSSHGMTVASIIKGPAQPRPAVDVGIAPNATLRDAAFYDVPRGSGEEGKREPTSAALTDQLRAIADGHRKGDGPTIVVVPVELAPTDAGAKKAMTGAVDRLVKAGVLVIAAAGDRPGEGDFLGDYAEAPKPGEDAAADVWPAAVDGVLSVGVSSPDAVGAVLRNSSIDLAAPGQGSVALALNGGYCVAAGPSTHWAAAQVAGVAALVWSLYPKASAEELQRRLEGTAAGNGGDASPLVGYGEVQAVEALLRAPDALAQQEQEPEVVPRAKAPPEREDLLADTRDNVVWWGLGGAGAIAVLLVLRPVLGRRRR